MVGTIIPTPDASYIAVVKQMYQQGDITLEQYASCLRRYTQRKEAVQYGRN